VVHLSLDPELDNEAPACLLGSASVALKTNHELLELVSGEHFGLSSHSLSFCTPLRGTLGRLWESCHVCALRTDLLGAEKVNFKKCSTVPHHLNINFSLVPLISVPRAKTR
jgi:hypothetical protein